MNIQRWAYQMTLLDDVVISARSATAGGHESLDYIPGQTLLGACAARLYSTLDEQAWDVFHSGKVRFGNALPLGVDGLPAYPMPLCWQQKKADPAKREDGQLDADKISNFQFRTQFPDGAQPQQLRTGYVNQYGEHLTPIKRLRMKTAIEHGTNRAAEAQLFGYDALQKGSRFGGWVETDADIDPAIFTQVTDALAERQLLLGRSRSAEYGRAKITAATYPPIELPTDKECTEITLWLLSDLAFYDEHGQPSLDPLPHYLGLPRGRVDWAKTFLRHRRYSPWNGYRRMPDLERSVIQQGSVIAYIFDEPVSIQYIHQQCEKGLGLYREAGLGRVVVNPGLLNSKKDPNFVSIIKREQQAKETLLGMHSWLINWLESRQDFDTQLAEINKQANALWKDFANAQKRAAIEKGIDTQTTPFGPSASQWGNVMEKARQNQPGEDLMQQLFGDGQKEDKESDAIIKTSAEGWKETFFHQEKKEQFKLAEWLYKQLTKLEENDNNKKLLPRIVQQLAHQARSAAQKQGQ